MTIDSPPLSPRLSRRTLIGGAALSVPAIAAVTAVPAFAASAAPTLALTSPNMYAVAAGTTTVSALLKDENGQPVAGKAVALTSPAGTTLSPATPTTDGNGIAVTTLTTADNWAVPGSTLTITGVTDIATASGVLTVLGANAYGTGTDNGRSGAGTTGRTPTQFALAFPSPIRSIATAYTFSLALLEDGTVWGVGSNASGQLGDGTTTYHNEWVKIPTLSNVTRIATTGDPSNPASYAVLSDGTVRSWGANPDGQLGDGTTTNSSTPVVVKDLGGITDITAGGSFALALSNVGAVYAWGRDIYGEIPTGSTSTPVVVDAVSNASQLAAGSITAYALVDGQVYAWGYGRDGQIGDGTSSDSAPTLVQGLTGVTRIAAGSSSGYAVTGGQVWSWGVGSDGQLGNGSTNGSDVPVPVSGLTGVTKIAALTNGAFALSASGIYGWGANAAGQLGNGSTDGSTTPLAVNGMTGVTDFSLNSFNSYSMSFIR